MKAVGEAKIIERLALHLPAEEPMADFENDNIDAVVEFMDRLLAFTLRDIFVETDPVSWVYTFASPLDEVAPLTVRIRPWQTLKHIDFKTNRRADLYRASHAARTLWDESVAAVCAEISHGAWQVLGRVGAPSAPFSELMPDQVERLVLEDQTGDGILHGEPIFSIRLLSAESHQVGRPARQLERAIQFLQQHWPDQRFPANKEIVRAAEREGLTLSDATIRRAQKEIRQNPSERT